MFLEGLRPPDAPQRHKQERQQAGAQSVEGWSQAAIDLLCALEDAAGNLRKATLALDSAGRPLGESQARALQASRAIWFLEGAGVWWANWRKWVKTSGLNCRPQMVRSESIRPHCLSEAGGDAYRKKIRVRSSSLLAL